jgi:hypothetical protein
VTLLARILKLQVNDVLKLNSTIKELEGKLLHRIELMANASQTVRDLEFFSLQLEQELVALRLPTDVSLLAGTSLEDMFIYYEVAKVQAYATATEIRLIIRLPLRGTDRVMKLYRTEPLPYISHY